MIQREAWYREALEEELERLRKTDPEAHLRALIRAGKPLGKEFPKDKLLEYARAGLLRGANLTDVEWAFTRINEGGERGARVNLEGAVFDGANLNQVGLEGVWLRGTSFRGCILYGANFRSAHLRQADFRKAKLNGARMSLAELQEARLDLAVLQEASLYGANLREANLRYAILGGHLRSANLTKANARGADFTGAYLGERPGNSAFFYETDLRGATYSPEQRSAMTGDPIES